MCVGAEDARVRGVAMLGARADFDDWAAHPRRFLEHARELGAIRHPAFPPSFEAWAREFRRFRPAARGPAAGPPAAPGAPRRGRPLRPGGRRPPVRRVPRRAPSCGCCPAPGTGSVTIPGPSPSCSAGSTASATWSATDGAERPADQSRRRRRIARTTAWGAVVRKSGRSGRPASLRSTALSSTELAGRGAGRGGCEVLRGDRLHLGGITAGRRGDLPGELEPADRAWLVTWWTPGATVQRQPAHHPGEVGGEGRMAPLIVDERTDAAARPAGAGWS